jgi:glycosyltransferase involved in cell wall biosynthesis
VKVLLDAFPLLAPKSGVGYYTYHLLHALQRQYGAQDEYVYFYGRRFSRQILERAPAVDAAVRRTLRRVLADPYRLTQPIKELVFRIGTHRIKPEIYHETNYVLLPFDGRQVVTVFDLSLLRHPETHPAGRVRFFEKYFNVRLRRADHVLVISEFTKRELMELAGVAADAITVTPLAPPTGLTRPADEQLAAFRARHDLPATFILYLGNLEPRKNLEMLLAAYDCLRQRRGATPPLVLAGEATWLSERVFEEITRRGLGGHVLTPGYVPEAELALWYAAASVFVYPSRYEGFGLPVVEAMAAGTPCIVADTSSLPEVSGDAAIKVGPDEIEGWADALEEVLDSRERSAEMRTAGYARAAQFSWEKCAAQTRAVYTQVVRRGKSEGTRLADERGSGL